VGCVVVRWAVGFGIGVALAGCAQTTRVGDTITPASLTSARKSVAIMRVGAASPECIHVQVLLGVRDGEGFRRHKPITVMNVRSLTEPPVAEIELDPDEYHVVAYACVKEKGAKVVGDSAGNALVYRTSYANFRLAPGEIVNVGYLHFHAKRVGANTFGRAIETDIQVTDWPLAELDRFKTRRGAIYAQMTTRLMSVGVTAAAAPDCPRLKALKADGKIQNVPAECGA
jgi:hypothetical protein